MPDWHSSCPELGCRQRCQRPGCRRPDDHLLTRYDRAQRCRFHGFDCVQPAFDLPQAPAFAPPRAGAASLLLPTGPSPLHPAHGPAGFLPEQDAWAEPLTRAGALRYLAVHLERSLGYIMGRVVRDDFRATPIAASMAARDLTCSDRTWLRDVRLLESMGIIRRLVRPGRPKGGGKNAGSLYLVNWERVPAGAWPRSKLRRGEGKPRQEPANGEIKTPTLREEMLSFFATQNPDKMTGNRPNGRDHFAAPGRSIPSSAADAAANQPGTVPTPLPPPQGGGDGQLSRGDPVPSSVANQVHQAPWYRSRR